MKSQYGLSTFPIQRKKISRASSVQYEKAEEMEDCLFTLPFRKVHEEYRDPIHHRKFSYLANSTHLALDMSLIVHSWKMFLESCDPNRHRLQKY